MHNNILLNGFIFKFNVKTVTRVAQDGGRFSIGVESILANALHSVLYIYGLNPGLY